MRCAFSDRHSVDYYIVNLRKSFCHALFELVKMLYFLVKVLVHHLRCNAKSCDSRYVVCSGTHAVLLAAAENERLHFCLAVDVQESNSFGSMDLMCADGQKMDIPFLRINTIFAECLDRIYMIQRLRTLLLDHCTDFLYRHNRTGLIIYHHCRYENSIRP